jgi:hypothetical protein
VCVISKRFFTHAAVNFKKGEAAQESMPRTAIGELRGRAYGYQSPDAGFSTGYLRAPSGAVKHDLEQREIKRAREEHGTVLG